MSKRFMVNGEVHVAVLSTTELIGDVSNGISVETYILSEREDQPRIGGMSSTTWTPLSYIQWLPSTIQEMSLEWIYGTTGEIL